jgi:sugar phosphate isomerase/epimerase
MKVSIRASMRPQRGSSDHPLKWAFEQGAAMGFDGLELCTQAGRGGQFSTAMTTALRQGILDLAAQHKMGILSLSADWAWAYSIFFPRYKGWGPGVALMAEEAKLARDLGAKAILIHFGESRGSWEDARSMIKEIAKEGEIYGVKFGFEANIWSNTTGFGPIDSLVRMVDEVGSPNFGIYLHNAWPRGGLPLHEEIEKAGASLLPSMHSSILTDGRIQIDWEKTVAAMKKYFADGAYTFEIPWEVAAENKKIVDEAFAKHA